MAETELFGSEQATGEETPPPDLSVVVTLFNEADSLEELYRRTVAALAPGPRSYELIFVDDGSSDGTFAVVERLHASDPRVRAVRFKRNFGQHPAMHAGLERARGGILVTMDGDLQNAPEDIPRLVEAVEAGVDVAHAPRAGRSRYSPGRLTRLALHVLAGFWPQPIQWIGVAMGIVCTLVATALGIYGVVYWVTRANFPGPLF